jgi:hypothetical protein
MYSLSGYKDNGPGYQIKYDSQEDEWSPSYTTHAQANGLIPHIWKALDPFAT